MIGILLSSLIGRCGTHRSASIPSLWIKCEGTGFLARWRATWYYPVDYAEADLPAEKEETSPYSRVPRTHSYRERSQAPPTPPPQGSLEAYCLMIPRKLRLPRAHFASATSGIRSVSPHFSLTVRKTAVSGGCAAVISKKVAKRATDRHLLKRRIFAVMLPWCDTSRSLVVYARAGSPSLPFSVLKRELTELLERAVGEARPSR